MISSPPLISPVIILVHPQMGENIGATARAMKNFGLSDLRLVSPRDRWPNAAALPMASGADDILEAVQVFNTFSESVADLHHVYATTARSRDLQKPAYTPSSVMPSCVEKAFLDEKIGFVFGAERSGLDNDVIALCHGIIHIPTRPDFWSLNLAQSVLLLAYEWFCTAYTTAEGTSLLNESTLRTENILQEDSPPAPHSEWMGLFDHFETELETRGFFFPEHKKPSMIRNLRTMLMRGHFNSQEIRTFRGIIKALTRTPRP